MTLYLKFKFSKQFIQRDNVIFRRVTSPCSPPFIHCNIKFISRYVPRELHAPIRNYYKWRQQARVGKFSHAVFEVVSLKIWKTNIKTDGLIAHHDSFNAILQSTSENTFFE